MRIAIFSPFSPDKSGISDFCEELIFELQNYATIDLFSSKMIANKNVCDKFSVYDIDSFDEVLRMEYDHVIYHVGNNIRYHKKIVEKFIQYPDVLELHDISLHHYLAGDTYASNDHKRYIEIMEYCHGEDGKHTAENFINGKIQAPWENQSAKYTVNKHLVDKANAVIVHSDMAKQIIKGIRPEVPVISIPLHTPNLLEDYEKFKKECKAKLKIPDDIIVMGSFGYATTAKRIPQILKALGEYKRVCNKKFVYYIVGKVENIDIQKLSREYGIEDCVAVTGFLELDDFKVYMGACDLCFNLRYPTQGESSASLHRMLGMGKPIIVTNVGTFEEYPDDIVIKVRYNEKEIEDIVSILIDLLNDTQKLSEKGKLAFEYAYRNCNIQKNATLYERFLGDLEEGNYQDDYIDHFLDGITQIEMLDLQYLDEKIEMLQDILGGRDEL